jgi:hypothetical protein
MARGDKVVGIRPGVEPAGESFDPAELVQMFELYAEMARKGEITSACVVTGSEDGPGYEVIAQSHWAMSGYLHWVAQDIADAEAMGDEMVEE